MHKKEIIKIYQSFERIRKQSHKAEFNIDSFTYLKSGDSLLFAKPVLGSNGPDCSKTRKKLEIRKLVEKLLCFPILK